MGIDTLTDPSPAVSAGLSSRHGLLDANRDALVLDPAFRGPRRPPGTVFDGAHAGDRDGTLASCGPEPVRHAIAHFQQVQLPAGPCGSP